MKETIKRIPLPDAVRDGRVAIDFWLEDGKAVDNRAVRLLYTLVDHASKSCNNTGNDNTGSRNTGDGNTGNWNSGDRNTGDGNSGYRNVGCGNSGNRNDGSRNSGDCNIGHDNAGSYNSGNCNTGRSNAGDCNTGRCNTGDWNSGDHNSGVCNTGDWNSGDNSSGCFNTDVERIRMFNRPSDWTYQDWRESDARRLLEQIGCEGAKWISSKNMTDAEKAIYSAHEVTGGILREVTDTENRQNWWRRLNSEEQEAIRSLPNFDKGIFESITGINVDDSKMEGED